MGGRGRHDVALRRARWTPVRALAVPCSRAAVSGDARARTRGAALPRRREQGTPVHASAVPRSRAAAAFRPQMRLLAPPAIASPAPS